ncbi:MAG: histidinol dehydrogenase [Actinomycetes bacterium]
MRTLDLRSMTGDLSEAIPRPEADVQSAEHVVRDVIEAVRVGGEVAVLDLGERFDGARPPQLRVPREVLHQALADLDPRVRQALEVAITRVRMVHGNELPVQRVTTVAPGATVTQRWVPVDRVGLYVPGGRAVYPSSVVMNVVPAQLAGVRSLAIASPPQAEFGSWPHPTILAAAQLLGVDEVYAAGGAQAIAWFALGPDPVSMATGPGNIYVTAAKRLLRDRMGIDSEAGPTEIMILADSDADPRYVAADLIGQAEHDVVAASVLVTDSGQLADQVCRELRTQVAQTKHVERITAALTGRQSAIALVRDLDQGIDVLNAYGSEHVEIMTRDASAVADKVRNAGAIFVGPWSPVPLGDYCAGSNHVLPTGGCANYSSGLSVYSFMRSIQVIDYNREALFDVAGDVRALAYAEDLPAHAASVDERFGMRRPWGEQ